MLAPKEKGFDNFRECMLDLLRPLDLGERSGRYYLSIGRHLLGKIPEAELDAMLFEKVKQLARVAKANRESPGKLIERAKDTTQPAAKLREEVDLIGRVANWRGRSQIAPKPRFQLPPHHT